MDIKKKDTLVHRSAIKWASTLLTSINHQIERLDLKDEDIAMNDYITQKALKYLSIISPQLVPFAQGFNFLLLITHRKFDEFGQTSSDNINHLEEMIQKEANLTWKALLRLKEGPVLNDYYCFRIGHFCQRYITFCGLHNYWGQLRLQVIMKVKIEEYWTNKIKGHEESNPKLIEKANIIREELNSLGLADLIDQFKPLKLDFETIKETFHQAYWDDFKNEVKKKNFGTVVKLLDEFKIMVASCYPSRADRHQEIHLALDSELIQQMIDHQAIDGDEIRKMVLYMLDLIKELQKPADDSEWQEWKKEVKCDFEKFNQLEKEQIFIFWTEFFPKFFRRVFEKITVIKEEINEFKKTPQYQYLSELKKKN